MNLSSWVAQDETGIPQGVSLGPEKSPPICFEAWELVLDRFFLTPDFPKVFPRKGVQDCEGVGFSWEGDSRGDAGQVWGWYWETIFLTSENAFGERALTFIKIPFLFWVYAIFSCTMYVNMSMYKFFMCSRLIACIICFCSLTVGIIIHMRYIFFYAMYPYYMCMVVEQRAV